MRPNTTFQLECSASPDGFDAVSVQNVGSTYIIVSRDLPAHSNGILINFSLYCNGALYVICWTGLPVTPTGTALQLECGVGRHQCCSQPAQHEDSPPGGPPDPESDTNDIVISLFINKIINPDKSFGSSSDPMCILLPQLSSLLVEHTAPNIHDSKHKRFHTLFDLLKNGLMSKYNVMCSSLDPMEELTATPAGAGCGLGRHEQEKTKALKKKVAKSHHSNKKDLLLCLDDLSMCDDDDPGSSADWIRAVDRGSLIHINNMTFELFLSMEQSIRRCVKAGQELGDARSQLKEDENVLFYWSILTANRSDDVATTILEMVVDLWITVQGFSLAGAWVEEYKITQKKTTQKSKALRKN
eukprot:Em0017g8a